jgi:glutamate/aspartate transport system permease protein
MMRLSSMRAVSAIAGAYVNLMRSIPLVLVIFWFYFCAPYIGMWLTSAPRPVQVGPEYSAFLTFTMFEAAYYCEIMRAGIQSIPRGQVAAGHALGLDYWQTMRNIVLPQALRNMLPVLLTESINLFKSTALVYVVGVRDFLTSAGLIGTRDNTIVGMYCLAALVYFLLCLGASLSVGRLQRRYAI